MQVKNHCFEESRVKGMMKTQLTLYFIPIFELIFNYCLGIWVIQSHN